MSSQSPHLQIPSHWEWGFNIWILEATSIPSTTGSNRKLIQTLITWSPSQEAVSEHSTWSLHKRSSDYKLTSIRESGIVWNAEKGCPHIFFSICHHTFQVSNKRIEYIFYMQRDIKCWFYVIRGWKFNFISSEEEVYRYMQNDNVGIFENIIMQLNENELYERRKHLSVFKKKLLQLLWISFDWVLTSATAFAAVSGSRATRSFNLTF